MRVLNYYNFSQSQLDRKQTEIFQWLRRNPNHHKNSKAYFALEVIQCALKLEKDDYIEDIIAIFCD